MSRIRKAVIPAAGLGTRFLPATKAQPKEMLPIVDKPTIQYIIEEAVQSGIEDVLIITGRNKRAIEDHFDRSIELELLLQKTAKEETLAEVRAISEMVDIHYVRQKEALGLGHAVACARKFVGDEPFAVLLGDDVIDAPEPCLKQMITSWQRHGGSVLGVQAVPEEQVSRYGVVAPVEEEVKMMTDRDALRQTFRVRDVVEKPKIADAPSRLAILGRYILDPSIFEILEHTPPGANGEIQLTDAIRVLAKEQPVWAYYFEGTRYDVGDRLGFLQATVDFALKRPDLRDGFLNHILSKVR